MKNTKPAKVPPKRWVPRNDEPALEDLLGRESLVWEVAEAVACCSPPQVFGIHGDWGAGKTSFLHQLKLHLSGECQGLDAQKPGNKNLEQIKANAKEQYGHVLVVWFEAWRYQFEKAPIVALLNEMRSQLEWHHKLLDKAIKLSEVAARSLFMGLDDLAKKIGIQSVSGIQKIGEKWEQDHLAVQMPSQLLRQHLEDILKKLLPDQEKDSLLTPRLIVIIDDLDRCEPESAFRLLEGIKIYLNLNNCVFVLGMNHGIIRDAIAQRIKENSGSEQAVLQANEYIEKLCQNIWHLPMVKDGGALLKNWLPVDTDLQECCDSLCGLTDECSCLPANPRKIKSFANVLLRFLAKFDGQDHPLDPPGHETFVLIMSCLYQFHQEIYRILEQKPEFYQMIFDWCDGKPVDHAVFKSLDRIRFRATAPTKLKPGEMQEAYPDPVHGNVLRAQILINRLGPVDKGIIEKYLLR